MSTRPRGHGGHGVHGGQGDDADVVIVGAGPVGMLLALLLGRRGWQVDVLERQATAFGRPRAVHLDHEAARILQNAGLMDDLAPQTEVMDSYLWRNAEGTPLLWLDGAAQVPALSGWPASTMFHQPDLERLLAEAVGRQPGIKVRTSHDVREADGFRPGDEAGSVVVRADGPGGTRVQVRARWVIGCDGADSRIRALAGLDVTDLHYQAEWLIVDVAPTAPARWSPLNIQVCDPARPTTAVSGGPGRRRFEFMRLPGDAPDGFGSAATAWRLLEPWGLTPANAVLERHALYTFGARLVDRWRRGRMLVAGDAAHQMPPFAGQGLCSGLRDAASLAWRLDLVLAGRAPDSLLDSYGTERGSQVRAEIDFSVELGKIICVLDPAAAAARDRDFAPLAEAGPAPVPDRPPLGTGVLRSGDPQAGQLAPQALVGAAGSQRRLDDVTGGGWVLLGYQADPAAELPAGLARWWARLGGRCFQLSPGGPLPDSTGAYGRWFAALERDIVLIRPDSYVFGTATGTGAAAALVDALHTALTGAGPESASTESASPEEERRDVW
ncbi:MAG: bifunctional 3-(3-hydroxy-phenyl)propionate/3-hydroxycinnamic acid hydroxylase [Streptosporangiaceae bacterium]